jgi:hypothetical protein
MTDGSKDLNRFSGIAIGNSSSTGFGIGPTGDSFPYGGSVGGGRGGGTHGPGAGINPMLVLQHAGYCYHQAANCSVQRRLRFEIAEEVKKTPLVMSSDRDAVVSLLLLLY